MARRLNATALAERRYEVAKMNREGMTLAEMGAKLGVNASTVCRDMAWVREEWRKSVVENYDHARAVELAKLNYVERCCWEAWEGSGQVRETRIVVQRLPDGGLMDKEAGTTTNVGSTCARTQDMAEPVPFSSALPNGEGGATVCVANHDAERRATLANQDAERRATPADHDQERGALYVCEKRETQAGKLSHLEGVVKCINKRWKLLEAGRPKESQLAPRRKAATRTSEPSDDAPRREQQAGGKWALQPMHCVRLTPGDSRIAAKVDSEGCKPVEEAGWEGKSALQPMHCVRPAPGDSRAAAKVDGQGRKSLEKDRADRPDPSRMNRWPVGPELCFDLARPRGDALMGWENQGPSAQERAACHGRKLVCFRPTPIYDSGSILRRPGVLPHEGTCRPRDHCGTTLRERPSRRGLSHTGRNCGAVTPIET